MHLLRSVGAKLLILFFVSTFLSVLLVGMISGGADAVLGAAVHVERVQEALKLSGCTIKGIPGRQDATGDTFLQLRDSFNERCSNFYSEYIRLIALQL